MLRKWENLPEYMRTDAVRPYYDILKKKKISLVLKRGFDFVLATLMLAFLMPVFVGLSIAIEMDSRGGIFFIQERVTQYGRKFRILKFRTMVANAESLGSQITVSNDMRVTRIGKILRKYRLDELPQIINIILGDMSFCGTRPEVPKFVREYDPEMMSTLLLPAGVTSEASIRFKNENELLESSSNIDIVYIEKILPEKMKYNLKGIREFSFFREMIIILKTIFVVLS